MTNRTIDTLVTITPDTKIDIMFQDAAEINIDTPMLYIKSGKEDISYFVEHEAKPELEEYINTEAKPLVSEIIVNIAEPTVTEYVENTIKPDIFEYSEIKKNEFQEIFSQIQTEADKCQNSSNQAEKFSLAAQESATNSLINATNAEQFAASASTSASNAVNMAETVHSLIANAKDEISQEINQADYVVERYQNGTNWYRKYKSGWIEQGGTKAYTSNNATITLTFLQPFSNTNYQFFRNSKFSATNGANDANFSGYFSANKTTTSVNLLGTGTNYASEFDWFAYGQGA